MDQLHHQHAGKQGWQQPQIQDKQKASGHHQPGGKLVAGGWRERISHGRHIANKAVARQGFTVGATAYFRHRPDNPVRHRSA
jgi:hypothetical protein